LITIIVLFTVIAAAAVWQLVLFLRADPTPSRSPLPTVSR
jgi:hypothetical protein